MVVCCVCRLFCFFKQKTAYEMRISDWSSDVCSSDLSRQGQEEARDRRQRSTVGPQDLRSLSQWRWRGWTDGGEEDRIVAQWSWLQLSRQALSCLQCR